MEAGGRQICKCNTDILILESDPKALNLRAFFVCVRVCLAHYCNSDTLYITVSCFQSMLDRFSLSLYKFTTAKAVSASIFLFSWSKLIYCFLVMQLEVQTDLKSLRRITKEKQNNSKIMRTRCSL